MKYVIDTSVNIKTYVQEQDSGKALRLRNEYHKGVHPLTGSQELTVPSADSSRAPIAR